MWPVVVMCVLGAPLPGEAETAAFKAAFAKGERAFEEQDYGTAITHFQEADRLRVTPEVAFDLAQCFERLGDEPFALYYYRLYLRRAPAASDSLEVSQRIGQTLATLSAQRVGYLELEAPRAEWLELGRRRIPAPPYAAFLAPGLYRINARFGTTVRSLSVQVNVGQTSTIRFEPAPPPLVTLENAEPEPLVSSSATRDPRVGLKVGGGVLLGLGVATIATAIALGASAAADGSASQDHTLAVSEAQRLASSANDRALAANVSFGVGGAVTTVGAVLLVLGLRPLAAVPGESEEPR